jgi:hypothetical protein
MFLNDFHINCLKKSQNNTCVCDALRPIVYICSPCVAINSTGENQPCEIIKYRHIDEPCYISLTLYHDRFSIPVSVYQQMWPIKTCFLRSISKMHLLECMYSHFVFNLSLISIKKICELTHNYGIIHTYFKVNPVIMTMSINSEIQLILTNDRLHVLTLFLFSFECMPFTFRLHKFIKLFDIYKF